MSTVDTAVTRSGLGSDRAILRTFALTLFTSAFLLFLIQPMFTKMVLPLLGGSPAVWSLALVFFQGVLLLGYAYAHALVKRFQPKVAVPIHLTVLAAAMVSLPIAIPLGWEEVPSSWQGIWLIGLFAAAVGLPFFAVSSNAPLLQAWFSRTGHAHGSDPYFLYGASNCGSFAALLLYPFLIEPLLPLGSQTAFWGAVYSLLVAMIACSGYIAWRYGVASTHAAAAADDASAVLAPHDRLIWTGLAFVPSGLLVGVTSYISTDLVAAPFLWVIPLALFLLTFVIAFQKRPWLSHRLMLGAHSLLVAPLCLILFAPAAWLWLMPAHLAAFFIATMVCHGELVRRRPAARHLTEFYLTMSLGGVLGGLFASLIAPHIFNRVYEYPILMLAALACRSDFWEALTGRGRVQLASFALLPLAFAVTGLFAGDTDIAIWTATAAFGGLVVFANKPLAQMGVLAAGLIVMMSLGVNQNAIERVRSFFGVNDVLAMDGGRYHMLRHGTTNHGVQGWSDGAGKPLAGKPVTLSYFYEGGPYDTAVKHLRAGTKLEKVAVVGLGAGALACYAEPGETWRFYEIDPEVIRIAQNPRLFTFMSTCAPGSDVVLGDGRLTVGRELAQSFDLIILDAFSSDSVPAHLMTVEAMRMYFSKLKPGGALIFNISNRFMDLRGVVHSVAAANGAIAYFNRLEEGVWTPDRRNFEEAPLIGVVAKSELSFGGIPEDSRWRRLDPARTVTPWTDDYANFIGAMWRMYKSGGLRAP